MRPERKKEHDNSTMMLTVWVDDLRLGVNLDDFHLSYGVLLARHRHGLRHRNLLDNGRLVEAGAGLRISGALDEEDLVCGGIPVYSVSQSVSQSVQEWCSQAKKKKLRDGSPNIGFVEDRVGARVADEGEGRVLPNNI
jgi:hypothetical protein